MKKILGDRVIRDHDVNPAIMIVIGNRDAKTLARLVDPRFVRNLGELAIAVIVIKQRRDWFEDIGMAICSIAFPALTTKNICKIPLHVACNHKIKEPVVVIVNPGGTG